MWTDSLILRIVTISDDDQQTLTRRFVDRGRRNDRLQYKDEWDFYLLIVRDRYPIFDRTER